MRPNKHVTGASFLKTSRLRPSEIVILDHALARLHKRTKLQSSRSEAVKLFQAGIQVDYDTIIQRGYHPNYAERVAEGQQTWYFLCQIEGYEFLAVVTIISDGRLAWITTLTPQ